MDKKTFYIENLGCAKNQVDAEVMANKLVKDGYVCINGAENAAETADVIIVNTCAFIESARKEAIDVFFTLNDAKKEGAKIIITGCLGERYKDELTKSLEEADEIRGVPKVPSTTRGDVLFSPKGTAYLKISEGCNHRCAFCAIPIIRGGLSSIDKDEILKEAKRLIKSGVKEINLIAQDLASYGFDKGDFNGLQSLLKDLIKIDGDFKIRCLYIHPDFFKDELIDIIKNSDGKIIPYFDIPIQHASESILKAMGRVHNKSDYKKMVEKIRKNFEDSYVRTTFLIGFKGETEETLLELKDFIKDVKFDAASFFEYSREEGTKGYKMVSKKELDALKPLLKKYKKELEDLQDSISSERLERFKGTTQNIMIEEKIEGSNMYFAHAPFQCPDVDGTIVVTNKSGKDLEIGSIYKSVITGVNNLDLEARIE